MPRLAVLAVAALTLASGCREETVQLGFRPRPGDRYEYRIEVRAESTATLGTEPPRRSVADDVFEARQSVLDVDPQGSRVEVHVRRAGGERRTFVARLDRAAQLVEVQRIEGLPASALGGLGLSEVFPTAAGAPPDRPLAPGDRWSIDEPLRFATAEPSRIVGRGRLAELGVVAGRPVARVESSYRLPVRRSSEEARGRLLIEGSQGTRATVAYDVEDGAVETVTARTIGDYRLTLLPPEGVAGAPVPGRLTVDVRSVTHRRH